MNVQVLSLSKGFQSISFQLGLSTSVYTLVFILSHSPNHQFMCDPFSEDIFLNSSWNSFESDYHCV